MKKSVLNIYKELGDLADRLSKIQEKCDHLTVLKTHKANTGNYDPSADCYWTDFHCQDCDKRWTEDGSK